MQYSIIKFSNPVSIKINPIQNPKQYLQFTLDNKNITNIKLDSSYDNTIYACGHKIITLEPTFPNMFQMSYSNIIGGNADELSVNQKMDKGDPTTTTVLLDELCYAGYNDSTNTDNQTLEEAANQRLSKNNGYDKLIYGNLDQRRIISDNKIYGYKSWWALANDSDIQSKLQSANLSQDQRDDPLLSTDPASAWKMNTMIYHPCFASKSAPVNNVDIINGTFITNPSNDEVSDNIFDINNNPESVGCYPTWNIYNREYTDTGISIADKDYLSIAWGGNIIIGNGLTVPFNEISFILFTASGSPISIVNISIAICFVISYHFVSVPISISPVFNV